MLVTENKEDHTMFKLHIDTSKYITSFFSFLIIIRSNHHHQPSGPFEKIFLKNLSKKIDIYNLISLIIKILHRYLEDTFTSIILVLAVLVTY